MISETLDGLAQYALPYTPDWGMEISLTARVEVDQVESLTKREARRAMASTLRCDLSFNLLLGRENTAAFRSALRVLQDTPVRVPFWPALLNSGFGARWYQSYTEAAGPGAVTSVSYSTTPGTLPTLLGYYTSAPTFQTITPDLVASTIHFRESSPATEALTLTSQSWTAGPAISTRTIYLFPFTLDWSQKVDAGIEEVMVKRDQLGFTRDTASQAYPQIGRRKPIFPLLLDNESAKLLRFFSDRRGPVEAFWLPGWFSECQLASDTSSGSANITLVDASLIADHSYLAFYLGDGSIITRHIASRSGNTLTLDSSPGTLPAAGTLVCTLMLARFDSTDLTLRWSGSRVATTKIQFCEVPQEYITPSGETYNTTIGNLPDKAYLYEITHGSEIWRWTNYETDLTYGGNTFSAKDFEHTEIVDGFAWDSDQSSLKMRNYTGSPFERAFMATLTERLGVTIYECNPIGTISTRTFLFQGWARQPQADGPFVTVSLDPFGSLFTRKVPSVLIQPNDNYALFDAGNRLNKSDWTFSGSITAISGRTLTMGSITWPGGTLPTIGDNYFALGYAERPAPNFARIPIVASTAITGGHITFDLAWAITLTPTETGWKIYPGYDRTAATAASKFSNLTNFGGFDLVPASNPTLTALQTTGSGTGKK